MVTRPDGARDFVQFVAQPPDTHFGGGLNRIWNATYQPLDPSVGIKIHVSGDTYIVNENGVWYTDTFSGRWNPELSRISVESRLGVTFRFDNAGNLIQAKNKRNVTIDYFPDGIYVNNVRKIEFIRNSVNGLLERILVPDTNVELIYEYILLNSPRLLIPIISRLQFLSLLLKVQLPE